MLCSHVVIHRDDDDDFLYGGTAQSESKPGKTQLKAYILFHRCFWGSEALLLSFMSSMFNNNLFDLLFTFVLQCHSREFCQSPRHRTSHISHKPRISFEKTTHPSNGVVAHLEAVAQANEVAAVDGGIPQGEEIEEEEEEVDMGDESEEDEDVSATLLRRG